MHLKAFSLFITYKERSAQTDRVLHDIFSLTQNMASFTTSIFYFCRSAGKLRKKAHARTTEVKTYVEKIQ